MFLALTHWGRVTHICVGKLTIIDSDNGLSPGRHQAIIWTNAGILLIGPLGTNFNEILIGIQTFSFKKMHLKMSSAKWHPFCVGLNVLMNIHHVQYTYSSCINCYDIPVMWVAYKTWQAVRRLGHNEWRYNYLIVIQVMNINVVSWSSDWIIWWRFSCCAEYISANIKIYVHFPQRSNLNHCRTRTFLA